MSKMSVVQIHQYGDPSVLKVEEVGGSAKKDAAMADFDAAGQIKTRQVLAFCPDGDLVRFARAGCCGGCWRSRGARDRRKSTRWRGAHRAVPRLPWP